MDLWVALACNGIGVVIPVLSPFGLGGCDLYGVGC